MRLSSSTTSIRMLFKVTSAFDSFHRIHIGMHYYYKRAKSAKVSVTVALSAALLSAVLIILMAVLPIDAQTAAKGGRGSAAAGAQSAETTTAAVELWLSGLWERVDDGYWLLDQDYLEQVMVIQRTCDRREAACSACCSARTGGSRRSRFARYC